jgi:hypothetical protein
MSSTNAAELIKSFSEAITITRYGIGSYSNGNYSAGTPTSVSALASIQPLNGREILNLPSLQHAKEVYKLYTSTELFTAIEGSSPHKADLVSFQGKVFEVQKVEKWEYDLSFFKALIVRVEQ